LCIRKNYIKRYGKAIEQLIQGTNALKDDIKEKYNKEYIPENKQEAVKGHEWLASSEKLEKKVLSHVCHLSLKLDSNELTEYSGKYYFLPYLNFLLNTA